MTNARIRQQIAELMSSAGLGYNRISQEVLYMLPDGFIDMYMELWELAMGPVVKSPSAALEESGKLGKAKTDSRHKGTSKGVGQGGGAGKRLKNGFMVRSEEALDYKELVDKRLRAIARDIKLELGDLHGTRRELEKETISRKARERGATRKEAEKIAEEAMRAKWGANGGSDRGFDQGSGSGSQSHSRTHRCGRGHILDRNWNFCPLDGLMSTDREILIQSLNDEGKEIDK